MNTSVKPAITDRTTKVRAIAAAENSPSINQAPRFRPSANSTESELGLPRKVRQQIRSHWCRGCGTYMTNPDGLCAKCRQPLVEEYKAKLNSPAEIGLAASLHAQGYEPHFQAIECEAVAGTRCKLCAGACYYIGLKKGNSYMAISRCVKCGNEIEI